MSTERQLEAWEKLILPGLQRTKDAEYQTALGQFNLAAKNWIEAGVRSRTIGAAVPPFTIPIPRRTIVEATDVIGAWMDDIQPVDPNIHLPVLPPPVAGLESSPAIANIGATGPINAQHDATLGMLGQIILDLSKIKKAMNIT